MSKPRDYERLLAEWSTSKVRLRHGDLWWRWDSRGYTYDMASAGLYDASFETWRDEDKVVPVDPEVFEIDALMQSLAEAERDLELLRKIRDHTDQPFLVEALQEKRARSLRFKRPKHAEYIADVIALLSPPAEKDGDQ